MRVKGCAGRLAAAWMLALCLAAPAFGGELSPAGSVDLYQVSTIGALSAGLYAGEMRLADVLRRGDFGLGTLTNLDGEMVILDGVPYQVKSDGVVRVVTPEEKTPFADVVFFKGNIDFGRVEGLDLDGLKAALTAKLPDPNRCYAVRLDGTFASVTARSVPAQSRPWPPLAEAVAHQTIFPLENVAGTVVGIYGPPSAPGLIPAGWHLHFISKDRTKGGHVLGLTVDQATAKADTVDLFTADFPDQPIPRGGDAGPGPGIE